MSQISSAIFPNKVTKNDDGKNHSSSLFFTFSGRLLSCNEICFFSILCLKIGLPLIRNSGSVRENLINNSEHPNFYSNCNVIGIAENSCVSVQCKGGTKMGCIKI